MRYLLSAIFAIIIGLALIGSYGETGMLAIPDTAWGAEKPEDASPPIAPSKVPRITKEELVKKLNDPDVIILDVRPEDQWKISKHEIYGAKHEDPEKVESWIDKYPKDKTYVLY